MKRKRKTQVRERETKTHYFLRNRRELNNITHKTVFAEMNDYENVHACYVIASIIRLRYVRKSMKKIAAVDRESKSYSPRQDVINFSYKVKFKLKSQVSFITMLLHNELIFLYY